MREERVTKNILKWLEQNEWSIINYDFPQSGTGIMIHPNSNINQNEKNKGGIIPDIIAVRNSEAVYFENKDHFVKSDFDKLNEIKFSNNYSDGLSDLLKKYEILRINYGIGIPSIKKEINKSKEHLVNIDFLVSTDVDGHVSIHYDINEVFANA